MMLLDYYEFTGDDYFLRTTLLPIAENVTTFYDEHWQRDNSGKIRFAPAQALETYQVGVTNPAPEIGGLRAVLPRLLALPSKVISVEQRDRWRRTWRDLPPLPLIQHEEKKIPESRRNLFRKI